MHEWDDLRFFLAVAQAGSVSAAATKLGVNQSTVSRRINQFEKSMNVRLFERLSTGYELTPEGEQLHRHVLKIDDEIQSIDRELMGKNIELNGIIRVTTSLAVSRYLLMPVFEQFNRQYPGIKLHLDTSSNIFNLTQREADVAIRVTRDAVPENLVGRPLGSIQFAVYGTRQYVESCQSTTNKNPLRWIGEDNNKAHPDWLPDTIGPLHLVMRCNEVLATRDAICHGLGVGRLPTFIGDTDEGLKQFGAGLPVPAAPVWLLTHADMRGVKRVQVFTSFVTKELGNRLGTA